MLLVEYDFPKQIMHFCPFISRSIFFSLPFFSFLKKKEEEKVQVSFIYNNNNKNPHTPDDTRTRDLSGIRVGANFKMM